MKDYFSALIFTRDRTISSSVLDVARYRLTVVSLVSEPSSLFCEAWLLINIDFSLVFQQFKQFIHYISQCRRPKIKSNPRPKLSCNTNIYTAFVKFSLLLLSNNTKSRSMRMLLCVTLHSNLSYYAAILIVLAGALTLSNEPTVAILAET